MKGKICLISLAPLLALSTVAPAIARNTDTCEDQPSLFAHEWPALKLTYNPDRLGEWRLPSSPRRPDRLTDAYVSVTLFQPDSEQDWHAEVSFRYDAVFAIFFNLQQLELSWESPDGTASSVYLPWGEGCQGLGRTLTAGSKFTETFRMPATQSLPLLLKPVFKIWGSQN